MATAAKVSPASAGRSAVVLRAQRSLWQDAWHTFSRDRLAVTGLVVLAVITLGALVGPYLWSDQGKEIDFGLSLSGPSLAHPFGNDDLGRDLLARAMLGARVSLAVGVSAVVLAITLGTTIGAVAGYFGRLDNPLMRLTDLFLSLPVLPLLLVLVYLFKDTLQRTIGLELGTFIMIVSVIGFLNWMPTARLVRASFLTLKQREFVEAARSVGAPHGRIIFRHILANSLSPVLVAATIGIGGAIITESTLSFLGLGFPPDQPTLGRILYEAVNYLDFAPHWAIVPGLAIFLIVLAINFIGDGLRDALDPRRKI